MPVRWIFTCPRCGQTQDNHSMLPCVAFDGGLLWPPEPNYVVEMETVPDE